METSKNIEKHFVVEKLLKIQQKRGLTKVAFADLIGFKEAKWNKISNGNQELSINELSKIAEKLQMQEIDIYTFPDKYTKEGIKETANEVLITMKLNDELKDKVLSFISQNENIEIIK